jgi:cell division inhibitor SulA
MLAVRVWPGNGFALPCSACDLDMAAARVGEVSVYTDWMSSFRRQKRAQVISAIAYIQPVRRLLRCRGHRRPHVRGTPMTQAVVLGEARIVRGATPTTR